MAYGGKEDRSSDLDRWCKRTPSPPQTWSAGEPAITSPCRGEVTGSTPVQTARRSQLDGRAPAFEAVGCEFESHRALQVHALAVRCEPVPAKDGERARLPPRAPFLTGVTETRLTLTQRLQVRFLGQERGRYRTRDVRAPGTGPAKCQFTGCGLTVSHLLWEQGIMGVRIPPSRLNAADARLVEHLHGKQE